MTVSCPRFKSVNCLSKQNGQKSELKESISQQIKESTYFSPIEGSITHSHPILQPTSSTPPTHLIHLIRLPLHPDSSLTHFHTIPPLTSLSTFEPNPKLTKDNLVTCYSFSSSSSSPSTTKTLLLSTSTLSVWPAPTDYLDFLPTLNPPPSSHNCTSVKMSGPT